MPERIPPVTTATLRPRTDERGRNLSAAQQEQKKVAVDFNPETLQITLTNLVQKGQGGKPAQTVTESTAKLSFTLIFDSTTTGEDVRVRTGKIAAMMDPVQVTTPGSGSSSGSGASGPRRRKVPAIVFFEWGTIAFEGYIDSYREDLDFFSSEGVPLRASLAISITQQERTFRARDDVAYDRSGVSRQLDLAGDAQSMAQDPTSDLARTAASAGDPAATRLLGVANGIENLRLPGVSSVLVTGQEGRGAVSFSASAGLSGGGGTPGGAFARLHVQTSAEPSRPRATLSVPDEQPAGVSLGIGAGTPIAVGGRACSGGSGSMGADVGVKADMGARIRFEE